MSHRIKLSLLLTTLLSLWGAMLIWLPPEASRQSGIAPDKMLPEKFSSWVRIDNHLANTSKVITADSRKDINEIAEGIYFGRDNQRIMISLSYGANQLDSRFNAHRPEYCYQAQGFETSSPVDLSMQIAGQDISVRTLLALKNGRREQITYWMTMADQPILPGLSRLLGQIKSALTGRIADGYLIRISSLDLSAENAVKSHRTFLNDWLSSLPAAYSVKLLGD